MNWTLFILVIYSILVAVLTTTGGDVRKTTENLILPQFYPPGAVFGIVWSILFVLFGIFIYYYSLELQIIGVIYFALVLLWTPIFVKSGSTATGFYYLLFVELLTILFIIASFYMSISNICYILIPQFLWVSFATFLSYSIYVLN